MSFSSTSDRHLEIEADGILLREGSVVFRSSVAFFLLKAFLNEERSQLFGLLFKGDLNESLFEHGSFEKGILFGFKQSFRNELPEVVRLVNMLLRLSRLSELCC